VVGRPVIILIIIVATSVGLLHGPNGQDRAIVFFHNVRGLEPSRSLVGIER
jgi:hypothetical protein